MTRTNFVVALCLFVAAAPAFAASLQAVPGPSPSDSATARYCLRVAPATGSLVETVQCWTRAQWVEQGVDVDQEWAKEGVAVLA